MMTCYGKDGPGVLTYYLIIMLAASGFFVPKIIIDHKQLKAMDNIEFSYNWNKKLHCNSFSTIRLRNEQKYKVGKTYNIIERRKGVLQHGKAKIVSITHFSIDKLSPAMAYLDTGYSPEEVRSLLQKMYKNKNIDWQHQQLSFIVLKKEKQQVEQSTMNL